MVNNNNIPPIEEIREVKYEVPSYEEFMQSYEYDSNLNYADLSGGGIGEVKGYGPTCVLLEHVTYSFHLRIECHNWNGYGGAVEVNSADGALLQAHFLENGLWNDSWQISDSVLYKCAGLVREAAKVGRNCPVDGYVKVWGKFWGGWEARWKGF